MTILEIDLEFSFRNTSISDQNNCARNEVGIWNSQIKNPAWKTELRIMKSQNRVKSNCDVIANFS